MPGHHQQCRPSAVATLAPPTILTLQQCRLRCHTLRHPSPSADHDHPPAQCDCGQPPGGRPPALSACPSQQCHHPTSRVPSSSRGPALSSGQPSSRPATWQCACPPAALPPPVSLPHSLSRWRHPPTAIAIPAVAGRPQRCQPQRVRRPRPPAVPGHSLSGHSSAAPPSQQSPGLPSTVATPSSGLTSNPWSPFLQQCDPTRPPSNGRHQCAGPSTCLGPPSSPALQPHSSAAAIARRPAPPRSPPPAESPATWQVWPPSVTLQPIRRPTLARRPHPPAGAPAPPQPAPPSSSRDTQQWRPRHPSGVACMTDPAWGPALQQSPAPPLGGALHCRGRCPALQRWRPLPDGRHLNLSRPLPHPSSSPTLQQVCHTSSGADPQPRALQRTTPAVAAPLPASPGPALQRGGGTLSSRPGRHASPTSLPSARSRNPTSPFDCLQQSPAPPLQPVAALPSVLTLSSAPASRVPSPMSGRPPSSRCGPHPPASRGPTLLSRRPHPPASAARPSGSAASTTLQQSPAHTNPVRPHPPAVAGPTLQRVACPTIQPYRDHLPDSV
ncbi:hypothetical protein DPEC_G00237700 [Dallia pectoralis]|uniref:Uncharacterized protein n=1 Tax=Dallia pectoralis TaxID=75939 RepID=A0ACC2FZ34_DALPE|nr:hypothetical protein DPEC_G00237700 [Dallia pectoralis]